MIQIESIIMEQCQFNGCKERLLEMIGILNRKSRKCMLVLILRKYNDNYLIDWYFSPIYKIIGTLFQHRFFNNETWIRPFIKEYIG